MAKQFKYSPLKAPKDFSMTLCMVADEGLPNLSLTIRVDFKTNRVKYIVENGLRQTALSTSKAAYRVFNAFLKGRFKA